MHLVKNEVSVNAMFSWSNKELNKIYLVYVGLLQTL